MNFLERYLWKSVLTSILITWLSLALLDRFFAFLSEMGDVAQKHNTAICKRCITH